MDKDKLVFNLREVAAPLHRTQRSLEKLLDARTGRIDLGVGIIRTLKLGGSRVVARHEFDRFLREAGIVAPGAEALDLEPAQPTARRGRKRQSPELGGVR